jgi:hypothetical protein
MRELIKIPEPQLLFRYNQALEDPRDGLTLFGPLDESGPFGIRYGVVGTEGGIERFSRWVGKINLPIYDAASDRARPPFFGFETIFKVPWDVQPAIRIRVSLEEIEENVYLDDGFQRVYKTVDIFTSRIIKAINEEEQKVDIWFVIIPDIVYKYCRPKSRVEEDLRIGTTERLSQKYVRTLRNQRPLFQEDLKLAKAYEYEVNFHNQLKARLLEYRALTQIIRESTIAPLDFPDLLGRPARGLHKLEASVAWSISTAVYYKVGGRPWKISDIRDGVCYIGLVFKQVPNDSNVRNACCAAQMFLDSGDGIVFKGDVGPWYNPDLGDYHLSRKAASELVDIAIKTYQEKVGYPPAELFLHGRVYFNDEECRGFRDVVGKETNLVGVRIRNTSDIKLYRKANMPLLRGLAYIHGKRTAYLWTKGFIPRLQTYPGREVPNPLQISLSRGNSELKTVLSDILALTKLNYNSCIHSDGVPVTLRFADAIGEILTAGPLPKDVPLPFRHYI